MRSDFHPNRVPYMADGPGGPQTHIDIEVDSLFAAMLSAGVPCAFAHDGIVYRLVPSEPVAKIVESGR